MANVLGSLLIELTANTAQFLGAMDKASYAAKKAGQEIEASFSKLGGIASSALAPFGAVGAQIGNALNTVGMGAGKAFASFSKLGPAMQVGAAGAVGLAAGAALAEAGLVGLTVHTALQTQRMDDLAQSTGVSIESLSTLAFIARGTGLDTETLAKGLERMSKSAFAAATTGSRAQTPYQRLAIAVKDAGGQMRSTTAIFADVADKFSKMPDGPAKTALAMQMFGRAGAELIPVLNQGKAAMEEQIATAKAFGLVLTEEDAARAEQFKQSLTALEGAFHGVAIQIMREMLPSLQGFVSFIVEDLKDSDGTIHTLIEGFGWLTKVIVSGIEIAVTALKLFGDMVKTIAAAIVIDWNAAGQVMSDIFHGQFEKAAADAKAAAQAMNYNFAAFYDDTTGRLSKLGTQLDKLWNPQAPKLRPHGDKGDGVGVNMTDQAMAAMAARMKSLQDQIEAWQKLGSAGSAAEALIAQAIAAGTKQLQAYQAQAAKSPVMKAFIDAHKQLIRNAAAAQIFGSAIKTTIDGLDKQREKLLEQGAAADEMAAAFEKGGAAVSQAALNAQFSDQRAQINVLVEAHAKLLAMWGAENPVVKELANGVASLNGILEATKAAAARAAQSQLNAELDQTLLKTKDLQPYVDALNQSYLQSADAVRQATENLQLEEWIEEQRLKGIQVTEAEIQKQTEIIRQNAATALDAETKKAAASYDLIGRYNDEIEALQRVHGALAAMGKDTTVVDATMVDAGARMLQQWDAAALKVGTLSQKFQAFFNEVQLMGKDLGGKIFGALLKTVDDLSSKLAEFVVTGKADFKSLFDSLMQDILKASFQKAISGMFTKIGGALGFDVGKTLGIAKPDGSVGNPFYVRMADGLGGILGGKIGGGGGGTAAAGAGGGGGASQGGAGGGSTDSLLSGFTSKISGFFGSLFSTMEKLFSSLFQMLSKVIGGIVNFIGGLFGGMRAGGGDVMPGKAYLVGERRPELFIPDVAGRIVPNLNGGQNGKQVVYAPVYNITTPDADSFRKSQSQILQTGYAAARMAHARNG